MKPRFALDLSEDAVSLLERADGGWAHVGAARFDDPALEDRLADLRAEAEARAPEGFVSKLILPNSQILYFEAQVTGPDQATRRAEIRAALDGRTPYRTDELAFDFSRAGDRARVAVVARVTLEEAEQFAHAYGFRPAAFVAAPEADRFAGEPFFGPTSVAESHLPEGQRFDRDQDPVRLISLPEPGMAASEAEAPEPVPAEAVAAAETEIDAAPPSEPEAPEAPFIDIADVDPVEPVAEPADALAIDAAPEPEVEPEAEETPQADAPAAEIAVPVEPEQARDNRPEELAIAAADETPAHDAPEPDATALPEAEAPVAEPVEVIAARDGSEDTPEAPPPTAFQSRRAPVAGDATPPTDEAGSRLAEILPRLGGLTPIAAKEKPPLPRLAAERAAPAPTASAGHAPGTGLAGAARPVGTVGRSIAGDRGDSPRLAGALPFLSAPRRLAAAAGGLAALMVLAWFFLLRTTPDPAPETPAPAVASAETAPAPVAEAPETAPAPVAAAPTPPETAARPVVDLPEPVISQVPPAILRAASAETSASPAYPGEAPAPGAALDADPTDTAALATDLPLGAQALPPPFGTLLRYDATGRIIATADGVVTPDGYLLVAGKPRRLPPARPAGLVPVSATPAPAVPTDPAAAAVPPAPYADPALAGKRPRPRPAGLAAPPAAAPADETALPATADPALATAALPPLAPPVDPRHASRQPRARPAELVAAAAAQRAQDEAIAEAAASAAKAEAEAAEAAMAKASRLAVVQSPRPRPRSAKATAAAGLTELADASADISIDTNAVEAALAAAQAEEPAPEPEVTSDAQTAEVDEPEPSDGIANMPTTRTVAKKSTFANAIDLGEVELIGVFGTSSSRRALVRMPSGGIKKVKLGDRLDGGRVVAIGPSELVYEKKGRTIRLAIMDRG